MEYKVLNGRIDTLQVNVKVGLTKEDKAAGIERLHADVIAALDGYKAVALEAEDDIATPFTFCDQTLYLKPHGSGKGIRWILHCPYLHLDMGKGKLNETVAHLRFSSHFLHAHEPGDVLALTYQFLIRLLGNERFTLQVREVHYCIDFMGWSPTKEDAERFVTRGCLHGTPAEELVMLPEFRQRGRRFKEFAFSRSGHHSCIIYDKTLEVPVSHKEWLYDVWNHNGWDGTSQVIRVECRYDRDCLREMGIECPYDLLDELPNMWAYSTQKWLRHTNPSQDSNQSRWDTSEMWQVVQQAGLQDMAAVPAVRVKKVENDAKRAMAGFIGFAVGWAVRARVSLRDIQEDGGGFLEWAYTPMQKYLTEKKAATFVDVMRARAQKLGLALVA